MKTKLEALFDNPNFGVGTISRGNGIMIYKSKLPVEFLMLEYVGRWEVYLNYYDDGEPFRNILVKGSSKKLEIAQKIAVRKLEKELNTHVR